MQVKSFMSAKGFHDFLDAKTNRLCIFERDYYQICFLREQNRMVKASKFW